MSQSSKLCNATQLTRIVVTYISKLGEVNSLIYFIIYANWESALADNVMEWRWVLHRWHLGCPSPYQKFATLCLFVFFSFNISLVTSQNAFLSMILRNIIFFMFDISLVTRRSDSLSGTSGGSSKFGEIALNYHCIDDIDLVVNWMLNIEKLVKICLASCLLAPPGVGCCFLLMLEYNSSSYLIKGWFPLINYYLNLTRKQKFTIIMDFC